MSSLPPNNSSILLRYIKDGVFRIGDKEPYNAKHFEQVFLALMDALAKNQPEIHTVFLNGHYTSLDDKELKLLTSALKTNTGLHTLKIEKGTYHSAGIKEFAHTVKQSKTLKSLTVGNSNLKAADHRLFADVLDENKSLTEFHWHSAETGPVANGAERDEVAGFTIRNILERNKNSVGIAASKEVAIAQSRKTKTYPLIPEINEVLVKFGMEAILTSSPYEDILFIPEKQLKNTRIDFGEIQQAFPELSNIYLFETIFAKAFSRYSMKAQQRDGVWGLAFKINPNDAKLSKSGIPILDKIDIAAEKIFSLVAVRKIMEVNSKLEWGLINSSLLQFWLAYTNPGYPNTLYPNRYADYADSSFEENYLIADRQVSHWEKIDEHNHPIFIAAKSMGIRAELCFPLGFTYHPSLRLCFPKTIDWERDATRTYRNYWEKDRTKAIQIYTDIIQKTDKYLEELKAAKNSPTTSASAASTAATVKTAANVGAAAATSSSAPILHSQASNKGFKDNKENREQNESTAKPNVSTQQSATPPTPKTDEKGKRPPK